MTTNKINAQEIATQAIQIATTKGQVVRNKAFKAAFERVETGWGKAILTDTFKIELRKAVDEQLKKAAHFTKSEVIVRKTDYEQVNAHGEYERGRKMTTLDTAVVSNKEQLLGMARCLTTHRQKVAKKEEGASEGDIRKERRMRNAIFGLINDMRLAGEDKSEEFKNIVKCVTGLPLLPREGVQAVVNNNNVGPVIPVAA